MNESEIDGQIEVESAPIDRSTTLEQAANHFFVNRDNSDLFLVAAQQSLEKGQSRALFEFLCESRQRDLLEFVGWDLVKVVFGFLSDENVESNDCGKVLLLICNKCNPREICLSLGELLSRDLTSQKLVSLLRLLLQACRRLEGKVAKIYANILWSLTGCIRNSKLSFDHLPEVLELTLDLLRPCVERTRNCLPGNSKSEDIKELEEELQSFLIKLLEYPLVLTEFSRNADEEIGIAQSLRDESGDRFRKCAETVVEFLGHIERCSFKDLFEYGTCQRKQRKKFSGCNSEGVDMKGCNETSVLPYVGLGYLAFLVRVERIGSHFVPVVLTGRYSLEKTIVYVNTMLSCGQVKVVSKGIRLLSTILAMVKPETLDHGLLDNDGDVFQVARILTSLMTHCEDAAIRKQAVQIFRGLLAKFQNRGRYKLLRLLNRGCHHAGLAELLILILKEEIANSLASRVDDEWFLGRNAEAFLRLIFCIPARVLQSEQGVVEERSRLLSALNLFRFLIIRDGEDKTRILTMLPELERTYLKPLMEAVILSKARLKVLLKEKQDEVGGKVITKQNTVNEEFFSVCTPDGHAVEKGSLQDQLQWLESASLSVDMIESVLVRVREICDAKRLART